MKPDLYAKAITALEARGLEAERIVAGLVAVLKHRGALKLLPSILHKYRLSHERAERNAPVLTVAREADAARARTESKAPETARVVVDEQLIGGWQLTSKGTLDDASFKTALLAMYRRALTQ